MEGGDQVNFLCVLDKFHGLIAAEYEAASSFAIFYDLHPLVTSALALPDLAFPIFLFDNILAFMCMFHIIPSDFSGLILNYLIIQEIHSQYNAVI
ncbi:MAG: hypothetical protein ACFFC5_03185 [Promethearchaeota archaeon]